MNKIISKACIFISLFFLFNTTGWTKKALILAGVPTRENDEVNFIQKQIQVTGLYESVDILKAGTDGPIPSFTQLTPYQLIVVFAGGRGFNNGKIIGDILHDYMKADSNHAVLTFLPYAWYNYSNSGVGGRFVEQYALVKQTMSVDTSTTSLDISSVVPHLLTQGLVAFSGGTYCDRLLINTANPGSKVVAKWADGTILAAYGSRRVDLNIYPLDKTVEPTGYDPEGTKLIQNAITFLSYTPLKATPEIASLPDTGISNKNQIEVSFTNTTASSLFIDSIQIEGANKGLFQVNTKNGKPLPSTSVPTQIDPMKSLDLLITFSPTSIGTFEADLILTLGSNRVYYSLIGKGVNSALTISPNLINFGAYSTITTPPKKTITITNSLSSMKTITVSKIMLADKTVFSATGAPVLPLLLFPGASFDIDIAFDPKGSKGLFTTRLEVESNDAGSPLILPIQARYGDPKLTLPASSFVFSPQAVGTAGPPQSIFLTNTGETNAVIHSIISGDTTFIVVNPPSMASPLTIPPGEIAFFQVYFKPSMAGLKKTTVTLKGNIPDEIVNLSAEGAYPEFSIDVSSIDFGTVYLGEQKGKIVTLSNTGKTTLLIESIKLDPAMMGMSTSSFSIKNPSTLPITVYPRSNVSIEVVCAPNNTMALGDLTAKLVVITNAQTEATKQVTLKGKADGGWLTLSESPVIFDNAPIYSTQKKTIQLKNQGNQTIRIQNIETTNNAEDPNNTLTAKIPSGVFSVDPGQSLDVVFEFRSFTAGSFSKTIKIQTEYQTLSILLKGTALNPNISISLMKLDFSPTLVGSKSNILSTTLKNTGSISLHNILLIPSAGLFDSAFQLLPGYKNILQPGEETELQFVFAPTQRTPIQTAQPKITANGFVLPMGVITLQGIAIDPILRIQPSQIQFKVTKDSSEPSELQIKNIRITNESEVALQFTPQWRNNLNSPFSVSWPAQFGTSSILLEARQSIDVTIGFKTDKNGNWEDTLDLLTDSNLVLDSIEVKAQQSPTPIDDGCHITSSSSTSSGAWMVFLALIVLAYRLRHKQSLRQN